MVRRMTEIIRTVNLRKTYGELAALDNLNLSIKEGEIFGFLGLNGAGKTTTIRILLGMVSPTSGQAYLENQRVDRRSIDMWNNVGYIVETPYSYPELTVGENLEIVSRLKNIKDRNSVNWMLEKLKLEE